MPFVWGDSYLYANRALNLAETGNPLIENYFGPRIGSNGPEWMWDIPLPANHHFVLEYFIYMPWPSAEHEDQYLFWWNHEQAIATETGVEYLSPPQEELYLIR